MATVSIKLPHVAWREGRPRFQPGPKVRRLGFKGEDLRHDTPAGPKTGDWYTLAEAATWAADRDKEIAAARRRRKAGLPLDAAQARLPGRSALYTVEDLFEDWFRSPKMGGAVVYEGKRRIKPYAATTVDQYRRRARALQKFDPELYGAAVAALDRNILFGLFEDLWSEHGLHVARFTIATLSSALSWGIRRGKVKGPDGRVMAVNPARDLGMETPEPSVRAGELDEIRCLVETADALGRYDVGDCIMLGVWTGQRQADRLSLVDVGLVEGRRMFKQSKTGAIVAIPESPELATRLAAAHERRGNAKILHRSIIIDETTGAPFGRAAYYRLAYSAVRAEAVKAMPSLADFQDRDLRDTAVTWLARAGCTIPEICSITGHSFKTAEAILRHYLAKHPELADTAMAKMVRWFEAKQKIA